jgi:hypothetical protein
MLDDWRSSGFERVDPFALLLWHIGPPVIVTAEHVRLHIVGSRPLGCNAGSAEKVATIVPRREPSHGYESTLAGAIHGVAGTSGRSADYRRGQADGAI